MFEAKSNLYLIIGIPGSVDITFSINGEFTIAGMLKLYWKSPLIGEILPEKALYGYILVNGFLLFYHKGPTVNKCEPASQ